MAENLENKAEVQDVFDKMQVSMRKHNVLSGGMVLLMCATAVTLTYMTYVNQINHADNCQYPSGFERAKYIENPTL